MILSERETLQHLSELNSQKPPGTRIIQITEISELKKSSSNFMSLVLVIKNPDCSYYTTELTTFCNINLDKVDKEMQKPDTTFFLFYKVS